MVEVQAVALNQRSGEGEVPSPRGERERAEGVLFSPSEVQIEEEQSERVPSAYEVEMGGSEAPRKRARILKLPAWCLFKRNKLIVSALQPRAERES